MWISKSKYETLQNRLAFYEATHSDYLKLMKENSKLREQVNKLIYKIATNKEKCYNVTFLIRGLKQVKYTINALDLEEARKIAIEQFEKDNKAFTKNDISAIFYGEA